MYDLIFRALFSGDYLQHWSSLAALQSVTGSELGQSWLYRKIQPQSGWAAPALQAG